jgi:hypothetical protein
VIHVWNSDAVCIPLAELILWLKTEVLFLHVFVQESLDKVLEDAVRMNDPFKVYTQMLQIYADSGKAEV